MTRQYSVPLAATGLVTIVVCMTAALTSCRGQAQIGGEGPSPDILLLTIDTLRADHLGCYGYPRNTSPFLDGLARRGTVFSHAIAASASTGPSHTSILTGLDPTAHGVRANGMNLAKEISTLAELLSQSEYTTIAVVSSNGQFRPSGLDRGFSIFRDPADLDGHRRKEVRAGVTVDRAITELGKISPEVPVFLWVHLFDPHSPYDPLRPLSSGTPQQAAEHVRFLQSRHGAQLDLLGDSPTRLLRMVDAYDGEIRAVDEALPRLFSFFEDRTGKRSAMWFITSDHGEGLGSHGWILHGKNLYQEQIHVPLIVGSSDDRVIRQRLDGVVEHVDIFATVLDMAKTSACSDRYRSRAVSFGQALTGGAFEGKKFAVSERRSYDAEHHRSVVSDLKKPGARVPHLLQPGRVPFTEEDFFSRLMLQQIVDNFEDGETVVIQTMLQKLIHRTAGGDEMFDLKSDPSESFNIIGTPSARASDLRAVADLHISAVSRADAAETIVLDPETRELLRALGYFD